MVETVFKTIKSELVWMTVFQPRKQAIKAIGEYINGFYNPVRKHSALGYKSPIQFETEKQKMKELASPLNAGKSIDWLIVAIKSRKDVKCRGFKKHSKDHFYKFYWGRVWGRIILKFK